MKYSNKQAIQFSLLYILYMATGYRFFILIQTAQQQQTNKTNSIKSLFSFSGHGKNIYILL